MLHSEQIELRPVLHSQDDQIAAIANALLIEIYSGGLGSKLYAESLANLFLIHLLRRYCTQTNKLRTYSSGLSRYQLQHTLDFIEEHLSQDLKLQNIAEQLDMSQYYFCRLFKQSMGVSPYRYILTKRMELAKRLLKCQEQSIADIALMCGFSSQSQMTHHFRNFTGMTPNVYRKS